MNANSLQTNSVEMSRQFLCREISQSASIDRRLDGDPLIEVNEAICTLIISLEEQQQQTMATQALCAPYLGTLQQLLSSPNAVNQQGAIVAQVK